MKQEDLFDALDGLYAWDNGCASSGIFDVLLRERVEKYLNGLPYPEQNRILSVFLRETYFSDKGLSQGYGLEDAEKFIGWVRDFLATWPSAYRTTWTPRS